MANKEKQQEYYKLAADWVDWFLETQPNLLNIKAYHGIVIGDAYYSLEYNKYRMNHNVGAERVCAYTRIRNFKQWYLNVYQNGEHIKENS